MIFLKLLGVAIVCTFLIGWRAVVWERRARACLLVLYAATDWTSTSHVALLAHVSRHVVYLMLHTLERRGLAVSEKRGANTPSPQLFYRITPKGKGYVNAMKGTP